MLENANDDSGVAATSAADAACWRCGLVVPANSPVCPHCAAELTPLAIPVPRLPIRSVTDRSLSVLFGSFALLLFTGIVHYFILSGVYGNKEKLNEADRQQILVQVLVVECIDSVVIVGALLASLRPPTIKVPSEKRRITAWLMSFPLLAAMLALNFGYHFLLRSWLRFPPITDEMLERFDGLTLLAACIQPAIIEELYCRRFALDSLRSIVGNHTAIWISALMFGLLHVANLVGIPYLVLMGACLGYLRLASGTVVLPILLHFVHNLVVLLLSCLLV